MKVLTHLCEMHGVSDVSERFCQDKCQKSKASEQQELSEQDTSCHIQKSNF